MGPKNEMQVTTKKVDVGIEFHNHDFTGIDGANSNDVETLKNLLANKNIKLTKEQQAYLRYRISALGEIDKRTKSFTEDKTLGRLSKIEPQAKEVELVEGELYKDAMMFDDLKMNDFQVGSTCWSYSLSILLQSRGIKIDPMMIRAFKPTDDNRYNQDNTQSIFDYAELLEKLAPNTGMVTRTLYQANDLNELLVGLNNPSDEVLKSKASGIAGKLKDTLETGFKTNKSAVAINNNHHYITVVGLGKKNDQEGFFYKDSFRYQGATNPNKTYFMTYEDYAKNVLKGQEEKNKKNVGNDYGIECTWLQDYQVEKKKVKENEVEKEITTCKELDEMGLYQRDQATGEIKLSNRENAQNAQNQGAVNQGNAIQGNAIQNNVIQNNVNQGNAIQGAENQNTGNQGNAIQGAENQNTGNQGNAIQNNVNQNNVNQNNVNQGNAIQGAENQNTGNQNNAVQGGQQVPQRPVVYEQINFLIDNEKLNGQTVKRTDNTKKYVDQIYVPKKIYEGKPYVNELEYELEDSVKENYEKPSERKLYSSNHYGRFVNELTKELCDDDVSMFNITDMEVGVTETEEIEDKRKKFQDEVTTKWHGRVRSAGDRLQTARDNITEILKMVADYNKDKDELSKSRDWYVNFDTNLAQRLTQVKASLKSYLTISDDSLEASETYRTARRLSMKIDNLLDEHSKVKEELENLQLDHVLSSDVELYLNAEHQVKIQEAAISEAKEVHKNYYTQLEQVSLEIGEQMLILGGEQAYQERKAALEELTRAEDGLKVYIEENKNTKASFDSVLGENNENVNANNNNEAVEHAKNQKKEYEDRIKEFQDAIDAAKKKYEKGAEEGKTDAYNKLQELLTKQEKLMVSSKMASLKVASEQHKLNMAKAEMAKKSDKVKQGYETLREERVKNAADRIASSAEAIGDLVHNFAKLENKHAISKYLPESLKFGDLHNTANFENLYNAVHSLVNGMCPNFYGPNNTNDTTPNMDFVMGDSVIVDGKKYNINDCLEQIKEHATEYVNSHKEPRTKVGKARLEMAKQALMLCEGLEKKVKYYEEQKNMDIDKMIKSSHTILKEVTGFVGKEALAKKEQQDLDRDIAIIMSQEDNEQNGPVLNNNEQNAQVLNNSEQNGPVLNNNEQNAQVLNNSEQNGSVLNNSDPTAPVQNAQVSNNNDQTVPIQNAQELNNSNQNAQELNNSNQNVQAQNEQELNNSNQNVLAQDNSDPTAPVLNNSDQNAQVLNNSDQNAQVLNNSNQNVLAQDNSDPTAQVLNNSDPTAQVLNNSEQNPAVLNNNNPTAPVQNPAVLNNNDQTVPVSTSEVAQSGVNAGAGSSEVVNVLNDNEQNAQELNDNEQNAQELNDNDQNVPVPTSEVAQSGVNADEVDQNEESPSVVNPSGVDTGAGNSNVVNPPVEGQIAEELYGDNTNEERSELDASIGFIDDLFSSVLDGNEVEMEASQMINDQANVQNEGLEGIDNTNENQNGVNTGAESQNRETTSESNLSERNSIAENSIAGNSIAGNSNDGNSIVETMSELNPVRENSQAEEPQMNNDQADEQGEEQEHIGDPDAELNDLEHEIDNEHNPSLNFMNNMINQRRSQSEEYKRFVNQGDARIDELNTKIEQNQGRIDELNTEIEQSQDEILGNAEIHEDDVEATNMLNNNAVAGNQQRENVVESNAVGNSQQNAQVQNNNVVIAGAENQSNRDTSNDHQVGNNKKTGDSGVNLNELFNKNKKTNVKAPANGWELVNFKEIVDEYNDYRDQEKNSSRKKIENVNNKKKENKKAPAKNENTNKKEEITEQSFSDRRQAVEADFNKKLEMNPNLSPKEKRALALKTGLILKQIDKEQQDWHKEQKVARKKARDQLTKPVNTRSTTNDVRDAGLGNRHK